jgi:hypothetical protein
VKQQNETNSGVEENIERQALLGVKRRGKKKGNTLERGELERSEEQKSLKKGHSQHKTKQNKTTKTNHTLPT